MFVATPLPVGGGSHGNRPSPMVVRGTDTGRFSASLSPAYRPCSR